MMSNKKKDEINTQEDELQRRLKERRDKSFAKSFNLFNRHGTSSSFSMPKNDRPANLGNILETLDIPK